MALNGRGARRRLLSAALALAGAIGLVVVAVELARSGDRPSAADARPIDPGLATSLAQAPPSSPAAAALSRATRSSPTAPPTRSSTSSATPPDAGAGPIRVRIPSAAIVARVVPVGVDSRGNVQIPHDVATLGWYRFSSPPSSDAGSTVLVGHVDSARQGEGAMFALHSLTRGARIVLDMPDGVTRRYQVVSRAQFPKTAVPLRALFATAGAPRLTLITCGGSFDATIRSYRDNVVVTAVPR